MFKQPFMFQKPELAGAKIAELHLIDPLNSHLLVLMPPSHTRPQVYDCSTYVKYHFQRLSRWLATTARTMDFRSDSSAVPLILTFFASVVIPFIQVAV